MWRYILKKTKLHPPGKVFEVGSGGGIHLVQLALRGFKMTGNEYSPNGIRKTKEFIKEVESYHKHKLPIELIQGDFLEIEIPFGYDFVFQFGVFEHFLEIDQRVLATTKCYDLLRTGGCFVSFVPSGMHVRRERMRTEHECGYEVPEIDYTVELMEQEMQTVGFQNITIYPYSYFQYLLGCPPPSNVVNKMLALLFYSFMNVCLPERLLSTGFRQRHALGLIGIAWK